MMNNGIFDGIDQEKGPRLLMPALIDVSFLLLIFFMVSATLQRQEADLRLQLPDVTSVEDGDVPSMEHMRIEITGRGDIKLNREPIVGRGGASDTDVLTERLDRYVGMASATRSQPGVVLQCADAASEQRFIDVLNACNKAGVESVQLVSVAR